MIVSSDMLVDTASCGAILTQETHSSFVSRSVSFKVRRGFVAALQPFAELTTLVVSTEVQANPAVVEFIREAGKVPPSSPRVIQRTAPVQC